MSHFLKLIIAEYGKREKRSEARKEEAEEIKEVDDLGSPRKQSHCARSADSGGC